MLLAYVIVSVYKIFLLVTAKNVYWFAVSHSIEYGIIGIALICLYFDKKGQKLSFSFTRAKKMFSKSKHYILAALMVVVIQNTDHIMLTSMVGKSENGIYSAAITCVIIFQFVYVAIVDSFRPMILSLKKEKDPLYENNVSRLYGISLYLAIAQGIVFFVMAKIIVFILYGNDFSESIAVLRILVVYFVFSVMGLVRNVWILAEEKQKYLWIINLSGAVANIILNALLIPFWGACGAAFASLITQFFANFILGFIIKPLRENNKLMIKGLNPRFFVREIKNLVAEIVRKD
jgi:O-antigen/teichoic acid export membrane protein